jgi:hypothetical protein
MKETFNVCSTFVKECYLRNKWNSAAFSFLVIFLDSSTSGSLVGLSPFISKPSHATVSYQDQTKTNPFHIHLTASETKPAELEKYLQHPNKTIHISQPNPNKSLPQTASNFHPTPGPFKTSPKLVNLISHFSETQRLKR